MNEILMKNVENDRFAKLVGLKAIKVSEGYALTELVLNDNHYNGVDIIQGGVIFTLADYAFAIASNSRGFETVGINVNISYYKTAKGKVLRAEAKEISSQKKICGYSVDIFDEDGSIIAHFVGLGYTKRK